MLGIHRTTANLFSRRAARAPATCRPANHRSRRVWTVECLEGRTLLSTWPVTSLDDTGDNTLRWAIDQANADAGDDTIDIQVTGTITLHSALSELSDTTGPTEINGPGASALTVARSSDPGTPDFRVFTVDAGVSAKLDGLTITGGSADNGGGISNSGMLSINACTISGNSAGLGGGVVNDSGTLILTNSTVDGNRAWEVGGIENLFGTLTIKACIISRNMAHGGRAAASRTSTAR